MIRAVPGEVPARTAEAVPLAEMEAGKPYLGEAHGVSLFWCKCLPFALSGRKDFARRNLEQQRYTEKGIGETLSGRFFLEKT